MTVTRKPTNDRRALVHKHARWTRQQLMFSLPEYSRVIGDGRLFEVDGFRCELVVATDEGALTRIRSVLKSVVPVSLAFTVSTVAPTNGTEIDISSRLRSDMWLLDAPWTRFDVNALFSLADTSAPSGIIEFDTRHDRFEFVSCEALSFDETQHVIRAAAEKLDIPLRAFRVSADARLEAPSPNVLPLARLSRSLPGALHRALERDEDTWRDYCAWGAQGDLKAPPSFKPVEFAGFIDAGNQGDATLADLLAIYDVIYMIPPDDEVQWLKTNRVTVDDIVQLAGGGQVRVVLPQALFGYRSQLTAALADAVPESLILSRALAVRAITEGQKRDPLLHAPIPNEAKVAILGVLIDALPAELQPIVRSMYVEPLRHRNDALALQGAGAWLAHSVGSRFADVVFNHRGQDARLELMLAGASVEWSTALGASYIPRHYGEYDETRNALLVASLLSKVHRPTQPKFPSTEALHRVADGLLTLGALSPLEVASMSPGARTRFRELARKLMIQTADAEQLQQAIDAINQEVTSFERRRERLQSWTFRALGIGLIGKVVGDGFDALTVPCASVVAWWLGGLAMDKVPANVRGELDSFIQAMLGMALMTPVDAVIVSQSRDAVRQE